MTDTKRKLIPISKWESIHGWPSEHGLRALVRESPETDFKKVVVRVGNRVLIDEERFFEWVDLKGK